MKNLRYFAQRYVDWVIKLGRIRFSLFGLIIIAILAISVQIVLNLILSQKINWQDITRSTIFGLLTAPFVIYFFTLLVEKLERSRQQLAESLEKLEQNNRDKSTLLATISHELRTPLNGIIGLSHLLLDENLTEKQKNYLTTINLSAMSLEHIFADIIDLNKIDFNRIKLNLQPTETKLLINDIYNFANLMTKQKNIDFKLIIEDEMPDCLYLDRARISQIIWNLISNAVKFTEKGEVVLKITKKSKDYYAFCVIDSGIGIAKTELDKIFTMYYQVKENVYRSAGSGIGLAISKTLANLMQGDLTVESELGKGSQFCLTFNAKEAEVITENNPLKTLKLAILLVEDIELNIIVAKNILEKLGHQVDIATNGKQAIQLFEKKAYDFILLDIQLPDMSGFEIAQYLRENYKKEIYDYIPPLIAFTANIIQSEQEYLAKGMDGVLRKPLEINALQHCFNQFFDYDISPIIIQNETNEIFDLSLIQLIGIAQSKQNLTLFEQVMPNYLNELNQYYQHYLTDSSQQKQVQEMAHKIKGAAASVGLINLQQIAQFIQDENSPSWAKNIAIWVAQLNEQWQNDVAKLTDYLNESA